MYLQALAQSRNSLLRVTLRDGCPTHHLCHTSLQEQAPGYAGYSSGEHCTHVSTFVDRHSFDRSGFGCRYVCSMQHTLSCDQPSSLAQCSRRKRAWPLSPHCRYLSFSWNPRYHGSSSSFAQPARHRWPSCWQTPPEHYNSTRFSEICELHGGRLPSMVFSRVLNDTSAAQYCTLNLVACYIEKRRNMLK